MKTIHDLAADLDACVTNLRALLLTASRMDQRNQLGEAARVPDELARALACVADARNAAAYEARTTTETAA